MTRITNAAEFKQHVTFGKTPESTTLEFKQEYKPGKVSNAKIARDVAAMANTLGGTILVGVTEDSEHLALGFHPPGEKLKTRVHDVIRDYLTPKVQADVEEVEVDDHRVVAINIQPLEDGVAYLRDDPSKGDNTPYMFPYRDGNGVKYMLPSEVDSRRTHNRRTRLALCRLTRDCVLEDVKVSLETLLFERFKQSQFVTNEPHPGLRKPAVREIRVTKFTEHELLLSINSRNVTIPLAYVDEVWGVAHNLISLALRCVVILPEDFSTDWVQLVPPGVDYNL